MMKRKGFTLIELLIVVTIIGILAVALVPRIVGGSAAARDARRQTDLQTVATGLEYYLSENGDFSAITTTAGTDYCASDLSTYLANAIGSIPTDPQSTNSSKSAFGGGCADDGEYVVTFIPGTGETGANMTKYSVAVLLEVPTSGQDFVYTSAASTANYATYSALGTALAAAPYSTGAGYFIV